jgi:hypothetical protein
MNTVAKSTHARKAYFAHLDDQPGTLFRHTDGRLMFQAEATDRLTVIEPEHIPFLAVLGEMTLSTTQRVEEDQRRGRAAAIACTRGQEVR